jgi:hypothetical protein
MWYTNCNYIVSLELLLLALLAQHSLGGQQGANKTIEVSVYTRRQRKSKETLKLCSTNVLAALWQVDITC